mmetsp:Transcript_75098/g.200408  ORF Transcript_75098/g.200408 Transcript_75098/m.200408 type:complete len:296 (-) Transcript_75098:2563-3450(-)
MQLRQRGQHTPNKRGQPPGGQQRGGRGAEHCGEQGDDTGSKRSAEPSQQNGRNLLQGCGICLICQWNRQGRACQGRTSSISLICTLEFRRTAQDGLRHLLRPSGRRRRPRLHVRVLPQHPRLRSHLTPLRRAHHHMRWVRLQHHLHHRARLRATVARVPHPPRPRHPEGGRQQGGPRRQGRDRRAGGVHNFKRKPGGPLVVLCKHCPTPARYHGPHCGDCCGRALHLRARHHQLFRRLLIGTGQIAQRSSGAAQRKWSIRLVSVLNYLMYQQVLHSSQQRSRNLIHDNPARNLHQ